MITKVKYVAHVGSFNRIEIVKYVRETDKSIWIEGYGRALKISENIGYFDTWEEAKLYILASSQKKINEARETVVHYEKRYLEAEAFCDKWG